MKYLIFNVIVFLCFSCFANAQGQQNVRNVHLQGGTVNGGLHIASGIENFFGQDNTNRIFLTLNYQRLTRSVKVGQMVLKEQNAFLSTGYRKYFPVSYRISPYVGVNVLAGYQYVGNSKNGILAHKSTTDFLYGAGAHSGIEYRLNNSLSFFLEGAYLFEFDHSWILSVGVKYYF